MPDKTDDYSAGVLGEHRVMKAALVSFGALVLIAVVFLANYNWIQAHFYIRGAYLLDSGQSADLIWHNPHFNPRLAIIFGGAPYNAIHFSPLHNLANALSYVLPLNRVDYYASYEGFIYAALGVSMYFVLVATRANRTLAVTALTVALALATALLFSFNGGVLGAIAYPHFEMLWVSAALCFFWMLFSDRLWAAAIFFSLALIVREDSGFHLFGFILLQVLLDRWRGIYSRTQRCALLFAAAALAYSCFAILVQKFVFDGAGLFGRLYAGSPSFAHVTVSYVATRTVELVTVVAPWAAWAFLATALFALTDRRPAYLLGFVAVGPWVFLHVVAQPETNLHSYRAFPLILAMAWPALERARCDNRDRSALHGLWTILIIATVSLSSWLGIRAFTPPRDMAAAFVHGYRGPHDAFLALGRVLDSPDLDQRFGRMRMYDSVMAFQPRNLRYWHSIRPDLNRSQNRGEKIDTFFYTQNPYYLRDEVALLLNEQQFPRGYRLSGTNVLIATRLDLTLDSILGPFVLADQSAVKPE